MKPKIWKRYMDDSFEIVKTRETYSKPTLIVLTIQEAYNSPMNQKLKTPYISSTQKFRIWLLPQSGYCHSARYLPVSMATTYVDG